MIINCLNRRETQVFQDKTDTQLNEKEQLSPTSASLAADLCQSKGKSNPKIFPWFAQLLAQAEARIVIEPILAQSFRKHGCFLSLFTLLQCPKRVIRKDQSVALSQ